MSILDEIKLPSDIKKLDIKQKESLAKEIREYILKIVSKNGGHLASNLGVVELTIAMFSTFNMDKDKIIWDVGHQCYTHKILTGRKEGLNTLRQHKGIAGFPKSKESIYDAFDTGHSSTSISVALGMANVNKLQKKEDKVIAVIGDGSLTGGMALEALNDAGSSKANIIVILNDNGMSISKNVGGITNLLTTIRTKKTYKVSNNIIKRILNKIPVLGTGIVKLAHNIKKSIKQLVIPNMYFENIGFKYLGPVDGHDIEKLESILKKAKDIDGPILVHVVTKKGKGYSHAELSPDKFHGTAAFDIETGKCIKTSSKDYSKVFGNKLLKIAEQDEKIIAITASMKNGTGLKEFEQKFPERFFDVGIAEQHAVGLMAGMAKSGYKPVFTVYSSFLQRAYDQLIHDVAIPNLPVTICIDRAGIVGADGETHQGLFDMAYISHIPNFVIIAPKDFIELEQMLEFAVDLDKPVAVRYPRGNDGEGHFDTHEIINYGKAEIVSDGEDLTIVAIGKMVARASSVAKELKIKGISCEIINARFLKPLDEECIVKSALKTGRVITIEDGIVMGGLGSAVVECINKSSLKDIKVKTFGYKDTFVEHGSVDELEKEYGLDTESITKDILNMLKQA